MALDDETVCNPNQYEHDANWGSHYKWTGPQILKQLPDLCVMCAGVGTSGTMTGIGKYLGEVKPSVVRVGYVHFSRYVTMWTSQTKHEPESLQQWGTAYPDLARIHSWSRSNSLGGLQLMLWRRLAQPTPSAYL